MNNKESREISIEQRLRRVEDRWGSTAAGHGDVALTDAQRRWLDRRLDKFERDHDPGRPAPAAIAGIRRRL